MCRQRTLVRRLASSRAFFCAGASGSAQPKRTAAATIGASAPSRRASFSSEMQAALGRSDDTCPRTKARSRVPVMPGALRTPSTVSSTPTWLSSKITQPVATPGPSDATSSSSMPPSPPSLPNNRQAEPPEAARTRRPPNSSATANEMPDSAPISEARLVIDSETTASRRSFSQLPRCFARRGRSLTCKPLAAASAKAPLAFAS
mmetsp:Transcript_69196/g.175873  ORF Transcript_69196/g.175873 Transcript_69196/m.175873 type:complete len:204 (+) Transcript_69196:374-985(+)